MPKELIFTALPDWPGGGGGAWLVAEDQSRHSEGVRGQEIAMRMGKRERQGRVSREVRNANLVQTKDENLEEHLRQVN